MQHEKPKVIIIFPESIGKGTHYPYWHQLFASSTKIDSYMLYESLQKIKLKPFNLIERFWVILHYRLRGYYNVYIHYSYWSVILSKIIGQILPMKIYYWNCEKYERDPKDTLLNRALKYADVLVTGSVSIGNQYKKIFKLKNKQIRIVPNWVSRIATPTMVLGKNNINILFVHHLSPRKGSQELPLIIKETIKKIPNAHFHIIGDGPDKEGLTSLSHVTLYGNLSLKETAAFYKACSYFIMPSRAEGFPRVILEAMLYQIPFVATKVGNVAEIVSENQLPFLVSPQKPKQFARALVRLIKTKNKKSIIAANYKKVKAEYNKKIAVNAFESLFS
jgi:glycosyltransferase involved in cell wall biosynthesis